MIQASCMNPLKKALGQTMMFLVWDIVHKPDVVEADERPTGKLCRLIAERFAESFAQLAHKKSLRSPSVCCTHAA